MSKKTHEIFEIDGRTFVVKMMPAAEGMSVLKELLSRALPIDLLSMVSIGGKSIADSLNISGLRGSSGSKMSIDEFTALQMRLMRNVEERLSGGDVKVVDDVNNFKVDDLEYNLDLFMDLLLKVISVNYKDFFIEKMKKLGFMDKLEEMDDPKMKDLAMSFLG